MSRAEILEIEKLERRLLEAQELIDTLKEAIGRRDTEIYALKARLKELEAPQ